MADVGGPKRDELLEDIRTKLQALIPYGTDYAVEKRKVEPII